MPTTAQTYSVHTISPMNAGGAFTQTGNTVRVVFNGPSDLVWAAIRPGDPLFVWSAVDPRYDGLWTIQTIDPTNGVATFTHPTTGLPSSSGGVQVGVAVLTTTASTGFVPGINVGITANSESSFNISTTVRSVFANSTGWPDQFVIAYPQGTTFTPNGSGGTVSGLIYVPADAPQITSFTASPSSITLGNTSTLTWTTANAEQVTITPVGQASSIVTANDSVTVTPGATTQYLLVASGAGVRVQSTVTVTVTDGVTATISASPITLSAGQTSALTWSTAHAVSATLSPGVGAVGLSGATPVTPSATTTYTLTAIGSTGATSQSQVTVSVAGSSQTVNAIRAIPVQHFMACTWDAGAAGYIGDLLGQYPPYNMLASTRTEFSLAELDLNGASGSTFSSNVGANCCVKDFAGNFYFGIRSPGETTFHFTKIQIIPPGRLTLMSRTGWGATSTHDNGAGFTADQALDGNQNTYWWSGANVPQTITIDMGTSQYVDWWGINGGTAHTSDNPNQVTIVCDGTTVGTFTLGQAESFVPVRTQGRVWDFTFATATGGWCEIAEINAYTGTAAPIPQFARVASSDIIVANALGSHYGCWMAFDNTVIYGDNGSLFKLRSTDLSTVATGSSSAGPSGGLLGTIDSGQIVTTDGSSFYFLTAAETDIIITSVAVSGGDAVYSYSAHTGPDLIAGMSVIITGFGTSGNNVTAIITAPGANTFTVAKTTQADESHSASGVVDCFSNYKTTAISAFGITGTLDSGFFDPHATGKAWLVIDNGTDNQTQLYQVDINTTTVDVGPGVLPVRHGWNVQPDPTQSSRLYAIHTGDGHLYKVDTSSLAITSVPLPISSFEGNLVPDPDLTPTGIGYQSNTAITYAQGSQTNVFPGDVTSGNLLVVTYDVSGVVDPLTVTDTVGTTYSKAYASTGQPINIAVYYGIAAGTGANTVSVSGGTGGGMTQVAEFTGVNAVNDITPVDQYGSYGFSGSFTASLALTTTTDWDMLLVVAAKQELFNLNGFSTPTPYSFPLSSTNGALGWLAAGKHGHYNITTGTQGNGSGSAGAVILAFTANSPTVVTIGGSVYDPVLTLTNDTDGTRNPAFLATDQYTLSLTGAPPNTSLDLNVNGVWANAFGTTDSGGSWSYTNTFLSRSPSSYIQQFTQNFEAVRINGFLSNSLTFTVSTTNTTIPLSGLTLGITNFSDPSRNPVFLFTDQYQLSLTGATANSQVDINVNGGWTNGFGTTDSSGNWTYVNSFNDNALDISYLTRNPYSYVLLRVNGQLSTVLVCGVQFALDGLVWIQAAQNINFAGLWYGIDPLTGRVAQTMGAAPSGIFGGYNGSLSANVGTIYSTPGVGGLVAPTGVLPSLSVVVRLDPVATTSGGGGGGGGAITGGYITWYARGYDAALYVSDGITGWYRMSPTMPPEPGLAWSPFRRIRGGCSAVQSVETEPGSNNLLLGPASSGPILRRNTAVFTDNNVPYASYAIIGNIVLAHPGQMVGLRFITTDSRAKDSHGVANSRPTVAVLLDEIAPTTDVPFELLTQHVNDPPNLPASKTVYSDRFYLGQIDLPAWCRHMQLRFDWSADGKDFEILSYTLFGKQQDEV